MAQSTTEIIAIMDAQASNEVALSEINNTSQTGRWKAIKYIISKSIELLQLLFDTHTSSVNKTVEEERFGKLAWYGQKSLLYQHGRQLVEDEEYYDNSSLTEQEIADEQVVKFVSPSVTSDGEIVLKVASGEVGNRTALTLAQQTGLLTYMEKISPAGTHFIVISLPADLLRTFVNIQFDPLIIGLDGKRLDGSDDSPVITAINSYLSSIDFNNEFSNMKLEDIIQNVVGVKIVDIISSWSKYSGFDWAQIMSRYQPQAGYMSLDSSTAINYTPYV